MFAEHRILKSVGRIVKKSLTCCPFRRFTVLGIETSCDDTGCAIVTHDGKVLGEALNSQAVLHLRNGGIIPPIARDLHAKNIESVVADALQQNGITMRCVDAVAATVKPGLSLSLLVGARYGQKLAQEYKLPFLPIHHMEAHALSVRMLQEVEFPFLVLLISGGHCLIAIAQEVDKFYLLGKGLDDAPGEAFDKVARRLKLTNLAEFRDVGGGIAIERLAMKGNHTRFAFPPVLMQYRDCNFSFSGLKNTVRGHILHEEKLHGIIGDGVIPTVADLCASFQAAVTRHLCHRVQRAMEYIEMTGLIPPHKRSLVVAGGVACNQYIRGTLSKLCEAKDYQLAVPPSKLCTDNGLMIAWNGVERLRAGLGVVGPESAHLIDIEPRCPFGEDHSDSVRAADIKCQWVKLGLI